jgi:hypothetical protein
MTIGRRTRIFPLLKTIAKTGVAAALCWCLQTTVASATPLGPGDIAATTNDTAFDMIIVALTNPAALAAGNYEATAFNYQFTNASGLPLGGTILPLVLDSPAANTYRVLAMGSPIAFGGTTLFQTTAFGGTSSFALGAATTVFAGFYWDAGGTDRNPIGFTEALGSSTLQYGGADAPVLNANIGGGVQGISFFRQYDFSVDVESAAVPEPGTLTLSGIGVAAAYLARRRRA